MNRFNYKGILILIVGLTMFGASSQTRADQFVYVSMDGFSPDSVTIGVGQAVYWVVADDEGPYTISSFAGDWSPRYLYDEGDSGGLRFNEAGDYEYYDAFNFSSGVVHVGNAPPDAPPFAAITSPSDGSVFTAPASFSVSVEAFDMDDGVMDVEFYLGEEKVDDVYDPPYRTFISGLGAGTYSLTIIAYDYSGETATQSVAIQVKSGTPSTPSLAMPSMASGQVQLGLSGLSTGASVVLQSSSDLLTWASIQTNQVTESTMMLSAPTDAVNRFYRVVQMR